MNFPKLPKRGGARLAPKDKAEKPPKPPKKKKEDMSPEELKTYRDRMVKRMIIVSVTVLAVVMAVGALWVSVVQPPPSNPGPTHLGPNVTKNPEDPDAPDSGEAPEEETVGGKDGYYTFLVCGTDASDMLTDTIMLVSYNTTDNEVAVMSIPRDTMVNVSWDIKRINSVYGTLGMDKFKEHIAKTTGIYPTYHVFVDLTAFQDLVDTIGGVEFNVPQRMYYNDPTQNLLIDLQPGVQKLNGKQAMHVARFRSYAAGDIQRIQVQQDLVAAIIKQTLQAENILKINEFANIFAEKVDTDLTVGNIIWLAQKAINLNMEDISFHTLPGNYGAWQYSYSTGGNQSIVLPYGDEIIELVNEYMNPYDRDLTTKDLSLMYKNSNGSFGVTNGTLADKRAASAPPSASDSSGSKDDDEKDDDTKAPDPSPDSTGTGDSNTGKGSSGSNSSGTGTGNNKPGTSGDTSGDTGNDTPPTTTPDDSDSNTDEDDSKEPGIPTDPEPTPSGDVGVLPPIPTPATGGEGELGIPMN